MMADDPTRIARDFEIDYAAAPSPDILPSVPSSR